ncbi:MAG: aspartate aminotransferase family protein [Pseudomonadota bacterium]
MVVAPNSAAARDVAYMLHPYTNLAAHQEKGPAIMTKGEGVYLWDEDGKQYIEGLAGLWCVGLGFSEKRLVAAATRQLEALPYSHIFTHRSTPPVIELAERLMAIAPAPLAKAFFANSGSEAIDSAIKFAWYYNNALGRPEKKKIISRKRAYHGVTIAGGSLTALSYVQTGFDLPIDGILHCGTPDHYRNGHPGESEIDFADRLAAELDQQIIDEGPETVAAFFAEPVMGAGGVVVPPETYFEKIQAVLKRHDVLMVADEVICGFGRTGNMWGSQTYGIQPDILTCAKQLSSAYLPISAVLVSDRVYQVFEDYGKQVGNFGTGFTYGGHPVPAAVAVETLKIYEEDDIIGHVRAVCPHFQERLSDLSDHPLVGQSRGVGLIGAAEIVADKETKESYPPVAKVAQQVVDHAMDEGLILRACPGDIVGICPPLIIKSDEIDLLFDRLTRALDKTLGQL